MSARSGFAFACQHVSLWSSVLDRGPLTLCRTVRNRRMLALFLALAEVLTSCRRQRAD